MARVPRLPRLPIMTTPARERFAAERGQVGQLIPSRAGKQIVGEAETRGRPPQRVLDPIRARPGARRQATPRHGTADVDRSGNLVVDMHDATRLHRHEADLSHPDDRRRHVPYMLRSFPRASYHGRCQRPGSCCGEPPRGHRLRPPSRHGGPTHGHPDRLASPPHLPAILSQGEAPVPGTANGASRSTALTARRTTRSGASFRAGSPAAWDTHPPWAARRLQVVAVADRMGRARGAPHPGGDSSIRPLRYAGNCEKSSGGCSSRVTSKATPWLTAMTRSPSAKAGARSG